MTRHQVSPTTHTVELDQLTELNHRLLADEGPGITAAELGLAGTALRSEPGHSLPGSAVLVRLSWEGPPEYPYIHARFAPAAGQDGHLVADLHTQALLELNRIFGLHQRWGV